MKFRISQASNGLDNKFQIDPESGVITLRQKIDYESLPPSLNGRVIVTVVAYDLGVPSKSASVDVQVEVEVSLKSCWIQQMLPNIFRCVLYTFFFHNCSVKVQCI